MARSAVTLTTCGGVLLASAAVASAATTVKPGWECIPTTAGKAVVSGGDSTSGPSCASGTTAVLAPTYVASGIDGKRTVQFPSVNVQIVDGSGSTTKVNGTGNLVLGYDEDARAQAGSHNLILGEDQSYASYGAVVGGSGNTVEQPDGVVFGESNLVDGLNAFAAGDSNQANGVFSSVTGGESNQANGEWDAVSGGDSNTAASLASSVTGGEANDASGSETSISGGWANVIQGDVFASVSGGCANAIGTTATDPGCANGNPQAQSIAGGYDNVADGDLSFVAGGNSNDSAGSNSSVFGGYNNKVASDGGSSQSQFGGGDQFLSSSTDNESEVAATLFAPTN